MDLNGATVVVTGATAGIGAALVERLVEVGASPVAVGRSAEKLDRLRERRPDVPTLQCDLADRGSVERLADALQRDHPAASVLINNAAIQLNPRFTDEEFDIDGIEREIATNFAAPAFLSALMLGPFLARGGPAAFVNVSSGLAMFPKTGAAVYCGTKAAIHAFSQSLRYQLEGTPVRVFEMVLPLVDTAMTAGRGRRKISARAAAQEIVRAVQLGREEHYFGVSRAIPVLQRLAPGLGRRIMKRM